MLLVSYDIGNAYWTPTSFKQTLLVVGHDEMSEWYSEFRARKTTAGYVNGRVTVLFTTVSHRAPNNRPKTNISKIFDHFRFRFLIVRWQLRVHLSTVLDGNDSYAKIRNE